MKEAACYMLCQLAGKEANGANVRLPPPAARRSEVLGLSSLLACSGARRRGLPGTGKTMHPRGSSRLATQTECGSGGVCCSFARISRVCR